jgi:GMP synthase (glutamine-hydrolysing)
VSTTRFLPRALVVQVRRSLDAMRHERQCLDRLSADVAVLEYRNLIDEPDLTWADAQPFEVLIVGGSGECSATEDYEFSRSLSQVVQRWVQDSRPFLGSCWGHHFLARALGGKVLTEPETSEVGTFGVRLEPAGRRDPLFSMLPPSFQAQMGHHDYVAELPPGAESLAASERCPNQALRMIGKPVYSTQFHSELGRKEILERLKIYQEGYMEGTTMEEMRSRVGPSPAVKPLIARFIKMYT